MIVVRLRSVLKQRENAVKDNGGATEHIPEVSKVEQKKSCSKILQHNKTNFQAPRLKNILVLTCKVSTRQLFGLNVNVTLTVFIL